MCASVSDHVLHLGVEVLGRQLQLCARRGLPRTRVLAAAPGGWVCVPVRCAVGVPGGVLGCIVGARVDGGTTGGGACANRARGQLGGGDAEGEDEQGCRQEDDEPARGGPVGGCRVGAVVFAGVDARGEGERARKQADAGRDDAQARRRGYEGRVAAGHGQPQQHAAEGRERERLEDGSDAGDELHERTPIHQAPPMTAAATHVTVAHRRSTNTPRNCEDSSATFFTSIIGP